MHANHTIRATAKVKCIDNKQTPAQIKIKIQHKYIHCNQHKYITLNYINILSRLCLYNTLLIDEYLNLYSKILYRLKWGFKELIFIFHLFFNADSRKSNLEIKAGWWYTNPKDRTTQYCLSQIMAKQSISWLKNIFQINIYASIYSFLISKFSKNRQLFAARKPESC